MRESTLERDFRQQVEALGGQCYKFVSPGRRGVPDRIVVWPGRVTHFVEMKAPDKKPKPWQARMHDRLRGLGHQVFVLDSGPSISNYFRTIRDPQSD